MPFFTPLRYVQNGKVECKLRYSELNNKNKMQELKTGDIVMLKSGGPKMTIQRFLGDAKEVSAKVQDEALKIMKGNKSGDVICQWFDGNASKNDIFPVDSLEKQG